MDVFKSYNTVNALAGGNILQWEQVLEMPYNVVFIKLWMDKEQYLFQKRLYEIYKAKHK